MKSSTKQVLYWTPRILGILFALFISLFALDVFGEGYGFWESVGAFLIHLVPTFVILIALFVAWRREWIGAILFVGLGMFYLVVFRGDFDWITFLIIAGPLFLIGALFFVNWLYRAQLRDENAAT